MFDVKACPTKAELHRFLLGQAPEEEAARVQEHLSACGPCLDTVANVQPKDTLLAAIQAQAQAAHRGEEPFVEALMDKLSGLHNREPATTAFEAGSCSAAGISDARALLGFLAAPTQPGDLGRLGSYRVLRVLGAGGMGIVFEAMDTLLQRHVALKVMKPSLAADAGYRRRFLREAQATAAIEHDHIVTIHQVGEEQGVPFLAEQLLKGETLEDRLKRAGRLPTAEAIRIGREIAEGLNSAHARGLVHRDIKPGNVWLEQKHSSRARQEAGTAGPLPDGRGSDCRVKILDFGLARPVDDDAHLTQTGVVAGTPHYMAPEQAEGKPADARCDLFSLGCVLYRMTTGRMPFEGANTIAVLRALAVEQPKPPREFNAAVPQALADLTMKLLAKDPRDRPQTAAAVVQGLAAIERDEAARAKLRPRSRRWLPVAAAVLFLALAGTLTYFGPAAVYRFATDQGQLVVETDDADVEVTVKQNGQAVKIVDTKTGRALNLTAGEYQLELTRGKEGLKLTTNEFILKRGSAQIVKVWFDRAAVTARAEEKVGEVRRFEGHDGQVVAVAFSPDGRLAISGGNDNTMRLWDVASGQERGRFEGQSGAIWHLTFSPDGRRALSGGTDKTLRLWDVKTRKEIRHLDGHTAPVTSVAFSPDGRRALSGSHDHTMRLWDLDKGAELRVFRGHSEAVFSVAFSPDGELGLTGSGSYDKKPPAEHDYSMRLWDLETGQEVRRFGEHNNVVVAVAFTPAGNRVLSGGNLPRLWDVTSGKEVRRLASPNHIVWDASFSADGRRLVTGGPDKTVRLWDVATGKEIRRFEGHTDFVRRVACSAAGRYAISASYDKTVRLWRLPDAGNDESRPTGPFVVLPTARRVEQKYATLAEAIAAADSGDTIEIRGNGPFVSPNVNLGTRALVLRAGAGFEPVLQIDAKSLETNLPLLSTWGPLALEGLQFRHVEDGPTKEKWYQFIASTGAPFSAAHCRFFLKSRRMANALWLKESPRVELRHCEFGGAMNTAIQWPGLTASHQLEVSDCLCWGANYLVVYDQPRDLALRMYRNTFVGVTAVLHYYRQLPEPPASSDQRPFRIDARDNILDSDAAFILQVQAPGKFQPEVDQPLLPRCLAWSESSNLYTGGLLALSQTATAKSVGLIKSLPEWQSYWGLKDTGSLQRPPYYQGENVRNRKAAAPEKLTAADFRLHAASAGKGAGANGRDLGADVDKVGPGKAYENWKQTPDYQQWLAASGQITPFVVLAVADKTERKFSSLSEAAASAKSGDTIEIRGNGPFVTPKINLLGKKRALILRAGAGFQPVLQDDGQSLERNTDLLWTDGPLVVEGLHFRHVEDPAKKEGIYTFIRSHEAPLSVTHCRFFLKSSRNTAALAANSSPRVQVRHCEFAGAFNMAISSHVASFGELEIADCLCWGTNGFVHYSNFLAPEPRDFALRMYRNTFVASAGSSAVMHQYRQLPQPANADLRPFRIDAQENVLDCEVIFHFVQYEKGKFKPEMDKPLLARCLTWNESKNLYAGVLLRACPIS